MKSKLQAAIGNMRSLGTAIYKVIWLISVLNVSFVAPAGANLKAGQGASIHSASGVNAGMSDVVTVTLLIENVRNRDGKLRILVFGGAEGFPDDPGRAVFATTVEPKESISLEIPGLTLGDQYAFSVMHDENEDGELNTNFLGIPKEGIGLSQAPNLWLGKPKFTDCAEEITAGGQTVTVKIHYF